jgi:hypothetical protein
MAHLDSCRIRRELTGNIWTYYSIPDMNCEDDSHNSAFIQRETEGQ